VGVGKRHHLFFPTPIRDCWPPRRRDVRCNYELWYSLQTMMMLGATTWRQLWETEGSYQIIK
jgi:hypothetical protein